MKTMASLLKVFLFLSFLFLAVDAKYKIPGKSKTPKKLPLIKGDAIVKPDFETNFPGNWELIHQQSGVSAMQIQLMPTNKIIAYDDTIFHISRLLYPPGVPCVPFIDDMTKTQLQDCFAHGIEYDILTNQVRALKMTADPWCSSGGVAPDGTLVSSGGFLVGGKAMRYYGGNCQENCEFREYPNKLKEDRWYGTQVILPNGDFIVIGGRRSYSYEFLPKEGQTSAKAYFFPFLYETSDIDENNLYPFVHLSTDGNLFVFSNNRSLLLDPVSNKVVRTFPVLPGGSRNYPASGMSVLFPIELDGNNNGGKIKAEVLVCGGNTYDSFITAETRKVFLPALKDCNRMVITDPFPKWDTEEMPSGRVMGDALVLPNGQLLFINGAQQGTSAWWDADEPNYTPVLYYPKKVKGERFKLLKPSQIARMYHSTSAVLPSGKIWIGGSNTHGTYKDVDKFPTETRVEAFSPPYLDQNLDNVRPTIVEQFSQKILKYGIVFETQFLIQDENNVVTQNDIKVTIYYPPFTTHGYCMSQRLVVLQTQSLTGNKMDGYKIVANAPPSGNIAPPGYYMLFVVHRGVPSQGIWVHLE